MILHFSVTEFIFCSNNFLQVSMAADSNQNYLRNTSTLEFLDSLELHNFTPVYDEMIAPHVILELLITV